MTDKPIKFKVREFQWYQVQTKVRNIIHDLTLPVVQRCKDLDHALEQTRIDIASYKEKVSHVQHLVADHPDLSKVPVFARIDRQLKRLVHEDNELRFKIDNSEKVISDHFQRNSGQLAEFNNVLVNIKSVREQIQVDAVSHQQQLNSFLQRNKQHNLAAITSFEELRSQLCSKQAEMQQQFRTMQKKLTELSHQSDKSKIKVSQFQKESRAAREQRNNFYNDFKKLTSSNEMIEEKLTALKRLQFKLDKNSTSLDSFKKEMRLVMPLLFLKQIGEVLRFCLKSNELKKFVIFQNNKLKEIDDSNLALEFGQDENFDFTTIMTEMNRNSHDQLYTLKFNKLKEIGINPSKATPKDEQDVLALILAQKEQLTQHPSVEGLSESFSTMQKTMRKELEAVVESKLQQIVSEIQSVGQSSRSGQQFIEHWLDKVQDKVDEYRTCTKNECAAVLEVKQQLKQSHECLKQEQVKIDGRTQKVYAQFKMMLQFLLLQSHLQLQDQHDRQSIALMGMAEHFGETAAEKQASKRLSFSKQCLSCNGCPSTTMAAFKLACLSYSPSDITLEGQPYSRAEIIESANRILEGLVSNEQRGQLEGSRVQNMHLGKKMIGVSRRLRTESSQQQSGGKKSVSGHQSKRQGKKGFSIQQRYYHKREFF